MLDKLILKNLKKKSQSTSRDDPMIKDNQTFDFLETIMPPHDSGVDKNQISRFYKKKTKSTLKQPI